VAQLVEIFVVGALDFPVAFWRYHRFGLAVGEQVQQSICVIGFVCHEASAWQPLDQRLGLCAISHIAIGDDQLHGQAKGIDGQMQFGVQAALGAGKALVPRFAPAACGCALIWVASIISHSRSGSSAAMESSFTKVPRSRHR
jgi:hypothetical protein